MSVQPQRRQPTRLARPRDSPGTNTGVGCHFLLQCMKVKSKSEVAQSCPTLSDPMDCSPPGSSVHGIFQARVLEWVPIAFSESCYIQSKLSAYNRQLYLQDVLCKLHDNNKANTKTYNRFTKDKEKTIKAYYCRKSSIHKGRQ